MASNYFNKTHSNKSSISSNLVEGDDVSVVTTEMTELINQVEGYVTLLSDSDRNSQLTDEPVAKPLTFSLELLRMARDQLGIELKKRGRVEKKSEKKMTPEAASSLTSRIDTNHKLLKIKIGVSNMMDMISARLEKIPEPAICRSASEIKLEENIDETVKSGRKLSAKPKRKPSLVKKRVRQFEAATTTGTVRDDGYESEGPVKQDVQEDKKVPEQRPEQNESEQIPEQKEPEKTEPEQKKSEQKKSEKKKSEKKRSEKKKSELIETERKEPELKKPEEKEPEVKEPEVKEPEVKEPELKEPEEKESEEKKVSKVGNKKRTKKTEKKVQEEKITEECLEPSKKEEELVSPKEINYEATKQDVQVSAEESEGSREFYDRMRESAFAYKKINSEKKAKSRSSSKKSALACSGVTTCCDSEVSDLGQLLPIEDTSAEVIKHDEGDVLAVKGQVHFDTNDFSKMQPIDILNHHLSQNGVVAKFEVVSNDSGKELIAGYNYKCRVLDLEVAAEGRSRSIAKQEVAVAMLTLIYEQQINKTLPSSISAFTDQEITLLKPIMDGSIKENGINDLRRECLKTGQRMPVFKVLSTTGATGEHLVTVQCTALDFTAIGSERNKRGARRTAANSVLRQYNHKRLHQE